MEVHEDTFLSQPTLNPRKKQQQPSRSSSNLRQPLSQRNVNSKEDNGPNQKHKLPKTKNVKSIVNQDVHVEQAFKSKPNNVSSKTSIGLFSNDGTVPNKPKPKPNVHETHLRPTTISSSAVGRTHRTRRANFVGRAQRVLVQESSEEKEGGTVASSTSSIEAHIPIKEGDTDIADQGSKQSPQSSPLTQRQIDIRAFIQQQRDAKKELFTSREIKTTVGSTSRETMRKVFDSAQSPKTHISQTLKDETMTKNSSSSTNMRLRDFIQSQRDKVKQQQVTQYECLAVKDSEDLLALDSSFSLSDPDDEEEEKRNETIVHAKSPKNTTTQEVNFFHPQTPTKSNGFFVELKGSNPKKKTPSTPLLSLGNFQESVWLDFGSEQENVVGQSRSLPFVLGVRQSDPKPMYRVSVERIPTQKGFELQFETARTGDGSGTKEDEMTLYIPKGESRRFNVTWTPVEAGGVREAIYLKLQFGRVRVVVFGHAREVTVPKRRRKGVTSIKRSVAKSGSKTQSPTKSKHTERQKRLNNKDSTHKVKIKSASGNASCLEGKRIQNRKAISRLKPSPKKHERKQIEFSNIVSSNRSWAVYDNVWAAKQCVSFVKWLNHTFQSPDEILEYEQMTREENAVVQNLDRPTLRSLLLNRRRAQASHCAYAFYNGAHMAKMKKIITSEVNTSRMSLRSDNDVLANVRLRSQIISLLLSYSPCWLRLGLETIFNETITTDIAAEIIAKELEVRKNLGIKGPTQIAKVSMEHFFIDNTSNRLQAFNTLLLQTKPTMKRTLKEFILQRVLSDPVIKMKYTKGKCKIPSGRFETMYKEEMRQHFLKYILLLVVFLDGAKVNKIIKSSPRLFNKKGIIKSSKEFLAILCRDYLHGMGNIFKHLGSVGVTVTYEQRHIDELDFVVLNLATDLRDGIRLTKLAEIVLGEDDGSLVGQLRLPAVSRLQKLHNTERALTYFDEIGIPNIASIEPNHIIEGHRPQVLKLLWSIMSSYKLATLLHPKELMHEVEGIYSSKRYTKALKEATFEEGADICELLLQWCEAVCSCFQYDVKDFSNSFSDGTALCLIIHYYHPCILNRERILPTTASLKARGLSVSRSEEFETALENERRNCQIANDAMLEIGGIPNMFPLSDTINIPDERTTIICVAYLCSRLLELRTETLAATVIQKAFRTFVEPLKKEKTRKAALKVERFWINNRDSYFAVQRKKYKNAVLTIEAFFFSKLKALQREREFRIMNAVSEMLNFNLRC